MVLYLWEDRIFDSQTGIIIIISMANFIRENLTKKNVVAFVLGQVLSLLITSTGFSSSELARRGWLHVMYYTYLESVYICVSAVRNEEDFCLIQSSILSFYF